MPSSKGYTYKNSGIIAQGNQRAPRDPPRSYCSNRDSHSYHYSNINGSYYYVDSKGLGSKYYNDGNGGSSMITSASGYRTCSGYGKK